MHFDIGQRCLRGVSDFDLVESVAHQRVGHRVESHRHSRRRTKTDRRAGAQPFGIERELRRGGHEGKIALPRIDLVKADAHPRPRARPGN